MRRRTSPPRSPVMPPESAEDGAARVHAAAVTIFDRKNGKGADWQMMCLSTFLAAFTMLDELPEDARRRIAGRVHERSYSRMKPGPVEADPPSSKTVPPRMVSAFANTTNLKSKGPRPPH